MPRVVICIPCHNQGHFLREAINSCMMQDYENLHVVVLDDNSKDNTKEILHSLSHRYTNLHFLHSQEPSGTGGSFNKCIEFSKQPYIDADIIVLLCSDDAFTCPQVISDIVKTFETYPDCVHVSRWYHQFIDGDRRPVRAWRGDDVIELANNPSGMAFRRNAMSELSLSNKMFVEVSTLVSDIIQRGFYSILKYDTVAVRIHQSISRNKDYYLKRWTASPVQEWSKLGGQSLLNDFTSLIQIKNYFTMEAVLKETWNFIHLKPINIINPCFLFFALVAILTPRKILIHIPHWYRITFGRWFTKEVKREN